MKAQALCKTALREQRVSVRVINQFIMFVWYIQIIKSYILERGNKERQITYSFLKCFS